MSATRGMHSGGTAPRDEEIMVHARLALTTVTSEADAKRIALSLVESRLAACVNIIPGVRSVYRWKEKVEDQSELLLLIKTTDERLEELRFALTQIHPYEVPELLVLNPDEVADGYAKWLTDAVK
jgi:periplasmic divalent cation tolerance protein